MSKTTLPCLLLSFAFCLSASVTQAENWPGWRGPRGDGTSLEKQIPVQWDGTTGKNIAWKVVIPGEGHASPIIWNDRVFVATCLKDAQQRTLICLDARSGKTLWQKTVIKSKLETKHSLNSFASSTPATDGETVVVSFLEVDGRTVPAPNVGTPRPITPGRMVVAAYDFDGKQKWLVKPGDFISAHGYCSSPVIHDDLVIVNGDHDGVSYVVALDKKTGKTVWKTPRIHKTRSYVTPLIRKIAGRTQMVISGSKRIVSLDPKTGKQHWVIEGPTEQFVASMVYDGSKFYMAAGYPTYHVMAIRPDGNGDVTKSHIAWHAKNAKCYVPSPVVVGNYLFVADDRGTANCFDTATGERLWQDRMGRHFSGSLVTAGGLAYFPADDGITKVVRPGKTLDVVHENPLGEFSYTSPAISGGRLYLRGEKHLFCIGKPAE